MRGRGTRGVVIGAALIGVLLAPAVVVAQPGTSVPRCAAGLSLVKTVSGGSLYGTWAASRTDAWSVGSRYDGTTDVALAEHWDGSAWNQVPVDEVGMASYLEAVEGASPNDVWAVGYWSTNGGSLAALAEHWDGRSWSYVSTPSPGAIATYLVSLAVLSSDDVWAVGYQVTGSGVYQTVAEHWDGAVWSVIPTPNPGIGRDNLLQGVGAPASDDVWAVGFYESESGTRTLAARWNGSAWTQVESPNPGQTANVLNEVDAVSGEDVWAVGTYHDGSNNVSLAEHWDGSEWAVVPAPNVPDSGNVLNDVGAGAPGDVWAVGYYYNTVGDRVFETLALHWDGSSWTDTPSPNADPTSTVNYLQGVTTLPSGELWAVGLSATGGLAEHLCETSVLDRGFAPRTSTVIQGSAAAWRVPVADSTSHTITDASGLGLFDSGPRAPGTSFTFQFDWAATVAVVDTLTGHTGRVGIPVQARPPTGGLGEVFTITWSSAPAPPEFEFVVQIRRPGSDGFVDWRVNQTVRSGTFTPDAGPGTYAFRARPDVMEGDGSWSPPALIVVS